jgi:hypothetical protein
MIRYLPPDTVDRGTCKRCKASIRFVTLHNGKRLPCNPEPTTSGRLTAHYDPARGAYIEGSFLPRAELTIPYGWRRFDPHSDTCR